MVDLIRIHLEVQYPDPAEPTLSIIHDGTYTIQLRNSQPHETFQIGVIFKAEFTVRSSNPLTYHHIENYRRSITIPFSTVMSQPETVWPTIETFLFDIHILPRHITDRITARLKLLFHRELHYFYSELRPPILFHLELRREDEREVVELNYRPLCWIISDGLQWLIPGRLDRVDVETYDDESQWNEGSYDSLQWLNLEDIYYPNEVEADAEAVVLGGGMVSGDTMGSGFSQDMLSQLNEEEEDEEFYVEGDEEEELDFLFNDVELGFRPACPEAIERLKKVAVKGELDSCCICLEKFVEGSEATRMPCRHCFHSDCIVEWLGKNRVCPLCRFEIN